MMNFARQHWFDIGIVISLAIIIVIGTHLQYSLHDIIWLNFAALLLHQFEEYRFPGGFPQKLNTVFFKSDTMNSYPLNTNTALVINVVLGWCSYLLAALLLSNALWLCIATIMISLGNFFAHTILFNVRYKSFYNPGMFTAVVLFLPLCVCFFEFICIHHMATPIDFYIGIPLGILLNALIFLLIQVLKNKNTTFIFKKN
jgi:hypothetical protein